MRALHSSCSVEGGCLVAGSVLLMHWHKTQVLQKIWAARTTRLVQLLQHSDGTGRFGWLVHANLIRWYGIRDLWSRAVGPVLEMESNMILSFSLCSKIEDAFGWNMWVLHFALICNTRYLQHTHILNTHDKHTHNHTTKVLVVVFFVVFVCGGNCFFCVLCYVVFACFAFVE